MDFLRGGYFLRILRKDRQLSCTVGIVPVMKSRIPKFIAETQKKNNYQN